MESKREQAWVGLFVLVAAAVLIATVFWLSGALSGAATTYRVYFPFAGGLEPGAAVRYAGGPKVGRVEKVTLDPQDLSRIEIIFSVQSGVPVKPDSRVRIMALSPLGDNHLEIVPGSDKAPLAKSGSTLISDPYIDFNALTARLNDMQPYVEKLLKSLNERATELKVTIARVNDVLNDQNRANLSGSLTEVHGMLAENRAPIKSTIHNLNSLSQKIEPVLQDLRKTSAEANETLSHLDAMLGENRPDVRQSVVELRRSLANLQDLSGRLNKITDVNSENIDETLENLRQVSENLKEFTDTIKTRPYTLIRSSSPPEHKPGESR